MQAMRDAIAAGTFAAFEADFHAKRAEGDIPPI
jgi:queuine tRNA-ribosyltransferase